MTSMSSRYRPRRLREREVWRAMVREHRLAPEQLVMPLFVRPGRRVRAAIPSLPGQFQLSVDEAVAECRQLVAAGVPAVLLFGLADRKDERASRAYARDGIVQQAAQAIKRELPLLAVITDVCLCAFTTHGHCGVVATRRPRPKAAASRPAAPLAEGDYWIDNDASLPLLAKTAVSHAAAGADMVAPSDMMDGNVGAIRDALDQAGFSRLPILAYSVKYGSAFYGPFREAVDSAPRFGDRRSYQMDIANADEAVREARLDIQQGADILMVKPALAYLDIIWRLKQELGYPVAAFSVSGEYAMVKAAAARGWMPERQTWMEMLVAMKRAGADLIITYWAKDAAKALRER